MFIGEVVGNVWGTRKHASLTDKKLLLVRPIDPLTEQPLGDAQLVIDGGLGSGPGSVVLVLDEGGSARKVLGDENAPIRAVVCAVVDHVVSNGKVKKYA
jgi:microcompartment protein CcmK/EutM